MLWNERAPLTSAGLAPSSDKGSTFKGSSENNGREREQSARQSTGNVKNT